MAMAGHSSGFGAERRASRASKSAACARGARDDDAPPGQRPARASRARHRCPAFVQQGRAASAPAGRAARVSPECARLSVASTGIASRTRRPSAAPISPARCQCAPVQPSHTAAGTAQPPPSRARKARSALHGAGAWPGRRGRRAGSRRLVSGAGLDGQRALPDGGQHDRWGQLLGDRGRAGRGACSPAAASTIASYCPSRSLRRRVSTLPRMSRIGQVGAQRRATGRRGAGCWCPPARRAAGRAACAGGRDQHVARVGARQEGGDDHVGGQVRGQVFGAMDGQIDPPVAQRGLDLADEQALVADGRPAAGRAPRRRAW